MRDALAISASPGHAAEWLETDGLGGFASGTVSGIRTRRYHGLLTVATQPPAGRSVLVNGVEAWVVMNNGSFALTSNRYAPDVTHPIGAEIESFTSQPWPKWTYRLPNGLRIEHELFVRHGKSITALSWRLCEPSPNVRLMVRPMVSGRDYHALHRENPQFDFGPVCNNGVVSWRPYAGLPEVIVACNGMYRHEPLWFRNYLYEQERERGFESTEDLASPGAFEFNLTAEEAVLLMAPSKSKPAERSFSGRASAILGRLRSAERARRGGFESPLHRAADQYIVARGEGRTIIAGYPWFADWGRDTFIAIRGVCIAAGRLDHARQILLAWAETISRGMVPNRFTDSASDGGASGEPEYNSVDASLWYVVAIHEFLLAADRSGFMLSQRDRRRLVEAMTEIVAGYAAGTRFGIRRDESDGLLAAGERGQQLTWMDARVGDREITPRIGKPVEVNALWINALWAASLYSPRWREALAEARGSFIDRFWNQDRGCLYDVIDVDHRRGVVDGTLRPNQVFAVGGLPLQLLDGERARMVVDVVEGELWTPLGLRSLGSSESGYCARYEGAPAQRDGAYHQGTVWPWLAGAFIEAWMRARGSSREAKMEARQRFLSPLLEHLRDAGLGHVSEIVDGEAPHAPRGCPFQAWSVGELLRVDQLLGKRGGS